MRDDLHKKAPIPRRAQTVLKLAGRPADRCHPERLRDAAARALDQALKRSLSPEVQSALRLAMNQGEMFGLGRPVNQACSPVEGDLLTRLQTTPTKFDVCTAVEGVIQSLSASYVREVRATWLLSGLATARPFSPPFPPRLRPLRQPLLEVPAPASQSPLLQSTLDLTRICEASPRRGPPDDPSSLPTHRSIKANEWCGNDRSP
jgi:hypothetical protein